MVSPLTHSHSSLKMTSRAQCHSSLPQMLVLAISLMLIINHAMGDSAQEKQTCAAQLTGIATCLPYLGGNSKVPTTDCCGGLVQAIKDNKRCICLIIKDRDDPDLGLKISITLALGLPSLCQAPDNFSQCPALLHLDPKSAEAQAFNGQNSSNIGGSTSPSISPSSEISSQNGKSQGTVETVAAKNSAPFKGKRLMLESLVAGLLIWFFS